MVKPKVSHKPAIKGSSLVKTPLRVEGAERLSFNLSLLDSRFDFTHKNFSPVHYEKFCEALRNLSSKTWDEIFSSPRGGVMGNEYLPITKFRQTPTVPNRFKNKTKILILRYHGNRPLAGFRDGSVFFLVWIESEFNDLYIHDGKISNNRK